MRTGRTDVSSALIPIFAALGWLGIPIASFTAIYCCVRAVLLVLPCRPGGMFPLLLGKGGRGGCADVSLPPIRGGIALGEAFPINVWRLHGGVGRLLLRLRACRWCCLRPPFLFAFFRLGAGIVEACDAVGFDDVFHA